MPNWCQNKLEVYGVIPAEFAEWLRKDGGLVFGRVVPVAPAENGLEESIRQTAAWGTPWELDENEATECASNLLECGEAFFNTAWSPPEDFVEKLSALFPSVRFVLWYYEPGNHFAGFRTCLGGEAVSFEYTEEPVRLREIGADIFESVYDDEVAMTYDYDAGG
jgi:hypothetical protein